MALILILLAAALLPIILVVRRLVQRRDGMPRGRIIYQDTGRAVRPLASPLRPLVGKPDYVVELRPGIQVPVEYKSYRFGAQPPHADLLQLGAYLLLLEDLRGRKPPYGVLRYSNRTIRVPFTRRLRAEVLDTLAALQQARQAPPHGKPGRALCRRCPFAPICPDKP